MKYRRSALLAMIAGTLTLIVAATAGAITWNGYTSTPDGPFKSGGNAHGVVYVTSPCPNAPASPRYVEVGLSQYVNGVWVNQPTTVQQIGPDSCMNSNPFAAPPVSCTSGATTTWLTRTRILGNGGGSAWQNSAGKNLACRR